MRSSDGGWANSVMKIGKMNEDRPTSAAGFLPAGQVTGAVIGAFFDVYNALGFGFLESVYRRSLAEELRSRGLEVREEAPVAVRYRELEVGHFRLDLLVERSVACELKATMLLGPADKRQLINYLRATDLAVGLLLHFGPAPRFHRITPPRRFLADDVREVH